MFPQIRISAVIVIFLSLLFIAGEKPAHAQMIEPAGSTLPPIFVPGKKVRFTWWHGSEATVLNVTVLQVRGDWVYVQYPGSKGWIHPMSMDAFWDQYPE